MTAVTPLSVSQTQLRRQTIQVRWIAFLVAAATLAAGLYLGALGTAQIVLTGILLIYPPLTQWALQRRQQEPHSLLMQLDALMLGLCLPALQFAPVPSATVLIMVHANAVTSGGIRPWLLNLLLTALGSALGVLVFGPNWMPPDATPAAQTAIALLGLGAYVGVSARFAHQQTQAARAAQQHLAQQQRQAVELSRKLARYLSPQIWGQLFSGRRDARLETRRRPLTVFFSDIEGFSALSEALPLDTLTRVLNSYLTEMTRIALRYGGTVDKFIGDALVVFFGDPTSRGLRDDAFNCVAMALEMQQQMQLLQQRWRREGVTQTLAIRIGINSGSITVGNFGTPSRMDYTILGTDVNLASRLEGAARPGTILISERTFHLVRDRVIARQLAPLNVKGFSAPQTVYEVQHLSQRLQGTGFTAVQTEGFTLHLDLQRLPAEERPRVLRALAQAGKALMQQTQVQLDTELEGFSLHVDSSRLRERDCRKVIELLAQHARRVQQHRPQ